jgi:hypothetical protein
VVIDFDRLPDGSPGLWGVLAHMSRVDKRSGRVEAGERIGVVGYSGNVRPAGPAGAHLHFEVGRAARWASGNHVNPQRWLDAQKAAPPPASAPAAGADYGPVWIDRLHYGQQSSDSVKALQRALNAHPLAPPGNITLPISGGYFDQTDACVRACQAQHGAQWGEGTPDPPGASFVGRRQAEHLGLRIVG